MHNPDRRPLPFGLGYHPYFSVPLAPGGKAEDCTIEVPAGAYWVLDENLPTGTRCPWTRRATSEAAPALAESSSTTS